MVKINFRLLSKFAGIVFLIQCLFMTTALFVALFYKDGDAPAFQNSILIQFAVGLLLLAIGWKANSEYAGRREGLLTVALSWFLLAFFGMLPFYLGGYIPNPLNAYFETISGFTTTGSTILKDIESLPHGILFWRSLIQWQGGIGVIVFTVALIPMLGVNATMLYNAESPGVTHERFRPRVTQVAKRIWFVYFCLTALLAFLLWLGPMSLFDAVCHSFTAISTGGYSTKNTSIAYWNSAYVEYVISFFMLFGATNLTLIYFLFTGNAKRAWEDEEMRWFYSIVGGLTIFLTGYLLLAGFEDGFEVSLRHAFFQVSSLITSCGFATADFVSWGPSIWLLVLAIMSVCGMTGSTSGGMKIGRFAVLVKNFSNEFKKRTHPQAVLPIRMNKKVVPGSLIYQILAFTVVYFILIMLSSFVLTMNGVGFQEAIGASFSAIGNVGPGLGSLGPSGTFFDLPNLSKVLLCFMMVVGRLELFTVLTILHPGFWKQ